MKEMNFVGIKLLTELYWICDILLEMWDIGALFLSCRNLATKIKIAGKISTWSIS